MKFVLVFLLVSFSAHFFSQQTYGRADVWYILKSDSSMQYRFVTLLGDEEKEFFNNENFYVIDNEGELVNGTVELRDYEWIDNKIVDDLESIIRTSIEIKNGLMDGDYIEYCYESKKPKYRYVYAKGKLEKIQKYDCFENNQLIDECIISSKGTAILFDGRNFQVYQNRQKVFYWRGGKKYSSGRYNKEGLRIKIVDGQIRSFKSSKQVDYHKVSIINNEILIDKVLWLYFDKKGRNIIEFKHYKDHYIFDKKTKSFRIK